MNKGKPLIGTVKLPYENVQLLKKKAATRKLVRTIASPPIP